MTLPHLPIPPFLRTTDSVSKIMADVLFALLPVCFMAWLAFGMEPVMGDSRSLAAVPLRPNFCFPGFMSARRRPFPMVPRW